MRMAVAMVSESRLDLGALVSVATQTTHHNPATATDAKRTASQLAADVSIIDDFADNNAKLSLAVTYVGFMFAGFAHDIEEVIEYTRGLPHVHTGRCERHVRVVMIVGSLDDWDKVVVEGCKAHPLSTAREAFNQVYHILCQKGFRGMFEGLVQKPQKDNTFLLEHK